MKCEYCGGPNPQHMGCVRCGKASYCSSQCAMQDWPRHEKMCDVEHRKKHHHVSAPAQNVDVRIGPLRIGKDTYEHALGSLFSLLAKDGRAHDMASSQTAELESKIKRVIGNIAKKAGIHVGQVDDTVMPIHLANRNKDQKALLAGLKGMIQMLTVNRYIAYDTNQGATNITNALLRRDAKEAKTNGGLLGRMLDKK